MSFWRYRGRCTGRIIHFLYHYCGLDVAEQATIGASDVTYCGQRIATFTWHASFGLADVPVFAFEGEHADRWAERQTEKQEEAIADALPSVRDGDRIEVHANVLHAFKPEMYHGANIWAQIVAKTAPAFLVAHKTLYFRAGPHWHYWHREIGEWLRAEAP